MKVTRSTFAGAALALSMILVSTSALGAKVTISVQSVIPVKADEVTMLKEFARHVSESMG